VLSIDASGTELTVAIAASAGISAAACDSDGAGTDGVASSGLAYVLFDGPAVTLTAGLAEAADAGGGTR